MAIIFMWNCCRLEDINLTRLKRQGPNINNKTKLTRGSNVIVGRSKICHCPNNTEESSVLSTDAGQRDLEKIRFIKVHLSKCGT